MIRSLYLLVIVLFFAVSAKGQYPTLEPFRCDDSPTQNGQDTIQIYFDVNQFKLKPNELSKFDQMSHIPIESYSIYGFADITGDSLKNQVLSQNRALSVANYMTNVLNTPTRLINIATCGGSENAGKDLAANRRVTIVKNYMEKPYIPLNYFVKGEFGSELISQQPINLMINEFFTETALEENNLTTRSSSGQQLVSGGMFNFEFESEEDSLRFIDEKVKYCIPEDAYQDELTEKVNTEGYTFNLWTSVEGTNGEIIWEDSGIPFIKEGDKYCVETEGRNLLSPFSNRDIGITTIGIKIPFKPGVESLSMLKEGVTKRYVTDIFNPSNSTALYDTLCFSFVGNVAIGNLKQTKAIIIHNNTNLDTNTYELMNLTLLEDSAIELKHHGLVVNYLFEIPDSEYNNTPSSSTNWWKGLLRKLTGVNSKEEED